LLVVEGEIDMLVVLVEMVEDQLQQLPQRLEQALEVVVELNCQGELQDLINPDLPLQLQLKEQH
jgi:hypothetical protein